MLAFRSIYHVTQCSVNEQESRAYVVSRVPTQLEHAADAVGLCSVQTADVVAEARCYPVMRSSCVLVAVRVIVTSSPRAFVTHATRHSTND